MALDPDILAVLEMSKGMPPLRETPIERLRAPRPEALPPGPDVADVIDEQAPGPAGSLHIRIYKPFAKAPLPCILFIHGGGFVVGSIKTYDALARRLCLGTDALVASVEYRLAPEAPFPAAPDDCLAALKWLAKEAPRFGGDPARLAVAGDSAGGNLAAVTALRARDEGGPALKAQLLVYPVTDSHDGGGYPSLEENKEGYLLTSADLAWLDALYFSDGGDRHHPHFAVIRAKDHRGLPPALVITAQYDPLRDEGEAYGRKLRDAGVPVTVKRYDGVVHAFFAMPVAKTPEALKLSCDFLRTHLGS